MSFDVFVRRAPARAMLYTACFLALTSVTRAATPLVACKPDPTAKGVPLYDKPGGKVVRKVDVEAGWQGGPGLSLIQGKDDVSPATMWLEVKDASGRIVGYLAGADGGITCHTPS
ncbi:MAG: hypothetical protein R3D27_13585 [Hyphomicrobiaceae bacterium]